MAARDGFDLDHTSFAVHDAMAWARRLRRELGAVPIVGETLEEFRYLMLYVGTGTRGARLELLEPTGEGFLTRYLASSGEGPHHLTFTVPDLPAAVGSVRSLGFSVVGESYEHAGWQEAFLLPDRVHGTVIQLASSDKSYPAPAELLSSRVRDPSTMPAVAGATDQDWWAALWEEPSVATGAWVGPTYVASTDVGLSRRLFVDVLGAEPDERAGCLRLSWPSGSLEVHSAPTPGITGLGWSGTPGGLAIAGCPLMPGVM